MNLSDIFLTDGTISPKLMLWAFYLAVVIAAIIYHLINVQLSKLVKKLLETGADSPENAVSLAESDVQVGFLTKMCLKSPANYKNLLVAITADGKYYANTCYYDEPPKFKTLRAITRQRKSRVSDTKEEAVLDTKEGVSTVSLDTEKGLSQEISPDSTENPVTEADEMFNVKQSDTESDEKDEENQSFDTEISAQRPQRVTFNPLTARYYIPAEIHDKVKALYDKPKTKASIIILSLIGFAVVIFLASIALDAILNSVGTISK